MYEPSSFPDIQDLRHQRSELDKQISEDEKQQAAVQEEMMQLTIVLSRIQEALTRKVQ